MQKWWADNSKDRSGPGSYSPEEFGLDPAAIAEQFIFYSKRFGIRYLVWQSQGRRDLIWTR